MLNPQVIAQFIGDLDRYRLAVSCPQLLATPGVKYVADNGGQNGAYWLADAIASYQRDPRITENEKLLAMQFWTLEVDLAHHTAVLFLTDGDSDDRIIEQMIEYTDFDLSTIQFYICDNGDGTKTLMLPGEY